ncbi:hypothetical protein OG345_40165 [Streptomyces sp. NBC_01220]|uniref:hypothetical protein n=1 Tax=Streptomyces sp. NBC_01220 TaxID=2903781 RepID=UPI00352E73CE|nr:hypothetical protein OG345_40165 [Streptomyces sp. NBC_01220]
MQHFSEFNDEGLDTAVTMRQLLALAREYGMAVLVTARVATDEADELVGPAHLLREVADHADRVLLLDRPGVYWTNSGTSAATLGLLSDTKQAQPVALQLEADRCRFIPA